MPFQRVAMNACGQPIEQVILILLAGGSSAYRLERLDWHHLPTKHPARAAGADEKERVQAVVRAVLEPGRDRMTADQLNRFGGFRVLGKKRVHPRWIRFARRRVQ